MNHNEDLEEINKLYNKLSTEDKKIIDLIIKNLDLIDEITQEDISQEDLNKYTEMIIRKQDKFLYAILLYKKVKMEAEKSK